MGNWVLLIVAFFPVVCAPLAWLAGRKEGRRAMNAMAIFSLVEMSAVSSLFLTARGIAFTLDGFCGMGLRMRGDGFRLLYAFIACGMWLVTSVFSRDYLRHDHAPGRYAFFTLLTQGATVGLFLSDSLFTAFCFFEVMSMASYPWVSHEEDPAAMRAAETYLYVAVIGGLVMLMGILLLPAGMATASYSQIPSLQTDFSQLWLPAVLILFGFGAKAGAFPLHIWLPKAHPVAPAPASALLSGMLTKAGVLGMLILTLYVMRGETAFGALIFWLGVMTMFLGALLAIFSTNLKRTLACSSLSQIGFIMIGVGVQGLCVCENGLAAFGTIQHMMNHSIFKLVLFLCAGVVAMNAHALHLNEVRGFGRKKPLLHAVFLLAAAGISGIPGLSGYISKSLLHEGMLEYIHELQHLGQNALPYQIAEWIFLISGGMTLCYMTKLYICLFWQKNETRQAEYDGMKRYMSPLSAVVLGAAACLIPLLGLLPDVFMTGAGRLAQSFMNAADPAHMPVPYFSGENLLGALKSIVIGTVLFFLQRRFVMDNGMYPERWPKWLDLEDGVYRPALHGLTVIGGGVAVVCDRLMDGFLIPASKAIGGGFALGCDRLMDVLIPAMSAIGGFFARTCNAMGDALAMLARLTVLHPLHRREPVPVGNRLTYSMGRLMDRIVGAFNRIFHREKRSIHFESLLSAGMREAIGQFKHFTRSISFGLLMVCIGLIITLIFLK